MKNNTFIAVAAVVLLLVGAFIGSRLQKAFTPDCPTYSVERETLRPVVPDGKTVGVVKVAKVKPVQKRTAKHSETLLASAEGIDTTSVIKIDSAGVLEVPVSDRVYKTEEYKATVRGYMPELVDLELYPKTVIRDKPRRWALAVGPSATYAPGGQFVPGVGITLGFVIWSK